jgi:hypothetical protein
MRRGRSRGPYAKTAFWSRNGVSIRFRLLPRFSELHIRRLSGLELARGLRVADPGILRPQLQVLIFFRWQPNFSATLEKRVALALCEGYAFQLRGLGLLLFVWFTEVPVREVYEIRLTRSSLATPVRLPGQRVAKPDGAFNLGLRVEFVEFLEGQERCGGELARPVRAFQGRPRFGLTPEVAPNPRGKHRRGVSPSARGILLLAIGEGGVRRRRLPHDV